MVSVPATPLATGLAPRKMAVPGLGAIYGSEWLKLRARAAFWWCLGAVAVISIALPIIAYIVVRVHHRPPSDYNGFIWPQAIELGARVSGVLAILPILVACLVIGSEYQWGTLRVIVGSGASRVKLILAKLLVLLTFTALFTLASMVAATISGTVVGAITGKSTTLSWSYDGSFFLHILTTFLLIVFALLVTVSIGFVLTVLTHSLAVGIALAIAINFLNGILGAALSLLGHVGTIIQDGLPDSNISIVTGATGLTPKTPDHFVRAVIICALYIIILGIISAVVFRYRDIPSGS